MQIFITHWFERDLKQLLKKYRSLEHDLEALKTILQVSPEGNKSKHWNCIHKEELCSLFKVRLACVALKGKDKMRVIYAYRMEEESIELIELYYKGEQINEDGSRIKAYLSSLK